MDYLSYRRNIFRFFKVTGDIGPNIKEPKDIPSTRWIDIRLKEIS
jgi:hypothetical protein